MPASSGSSNRSRTRRCGLQPSRSRRSGRASTERSCSPTSSAPRSSSGSSVMPPGVTFGVGTTRRCGRPSSATMAGSSTMPGLASRSPSSRPATAYPAPSSSNARSSDIAARPASAPRCAEAQNRRTRSAGTWQAHNPPAMLDDAESPAQATPLRASAGGALDPLVQPQCSLSVQLRRTPGAVIGRSDELDAISQELKEATGRLAAVTLEGEPGIGKTRLLVAAAELAVNAGFTCVAITADEEIRGPFLLARSLFASSAIRDTAAGMPAEAAVNRVVQAISGRDEPGFETLSPDAKLLRPFA